jgi:hypothetical protein
MVVDVTKKELGSLIGGKYGVVVTCEVCGKPACTTGETGDYIRSGRKMRDYAHAFSFTLNAKNEPQMRVSDSCTLVVPDSKRARKTA